jgi:hypothetical protein
MIEACDDACNLRACVHFDRVFVIRPASVAILSFVEG